MIDKYWLFSPGHMGFKPRHWQTPESVLTDFQGYVALCAKNPISDKIPRPMTVRGFCLFARVSRNTYYHSLKNPINHEMAFALEMVNDAIVNQKIELAVAGVYRETIVSRLSGLSETVTQHVTTKSEPCDLSALSDAELTKMQSILEKANHAHPSS